MKQLIFLAIFAVVFCVGAYAQKSEVDVYYKSRNGDVVKDSAKAKFLKKTIFDQDGTMSIIEIDLRKKERVRQENYRNGNPVGIWIMDSKKIDCDSIYNQVISQDIPVIDLFKGTLNNEKPDGLEPAFYGNGKDDLNKFLAKNIRYPVAARENGIQGRVELQFVIDENGTVRNLSILKSVDASLDMESVRVALLFEKFTPTKLNGKPIKVAVRMPVSYKIQ
jgi:TonB family protein